MMGVLDKKKNSINLCVSKALTSGRRYEVKPKSGNPSLTHGGKTTFKLEIYSAHKP